MATHAQHHPAPTASACRANSSRMPAAGCCGRSARITGGWAPSRRSRLSPPWPPPSPASSPSAWASPPAQFRHARSMLPPQVRRGRAVQQRLLDARLRPDLRGQTTAARVRGVDWEFNAWGGLYSGLYFPVGPGRAGGAQGAGDRAPRSLPPPLVLEGGSIHVDGAGHLLTTEECLLNPNRNPGLTRGEIEAHLRDYLGIETDHLAAARRVQRRDRRACRQPVLLRAARALWR